MFVPLNASYTQRSQQLKMKKAIVILFGLIFFLGCQRAERDNLLLVNLIQGDWATDTYKENADEKTYTFTFQDSTCSYLYPYGEYTAFEISSDTLIISERTRRRRNGITGGNEKYQFKIIDLDEFELILSPISEGTVKLFKYLKETKFDTIHLKRIRPKNNVKIERIAFYSTACYGTCPSMYLEIDDEGNILFHGRNYTEKDGFFTGQISDVELQLIEQKIHNIDLDSLLKRYSAPWTDSQTCGVKIKTSTNEIESSAYGLNKEPVELRILFHRLMEVYKVAELKQDSTIGSEFQFPEFRYSGLPPPPPLLSNENK